LKPTWKKLTNKTLDRQLAILSPLRLLSRRLIRWLCIALARLLRKRVKKFVALAPEVRADANPKTVHDVRVWSRRLQQAVSAFFPKPRSGKVRRLRRTPRRIRRVLGEWRNEVNL
jgi:CHAD domain